MPPSSYPTRMPFNIFTNSSHSTDLKCSLSHPSSDSTTLISFALNILLSQVLVQQLSTSAITHHADHFHSPLQLPPLQPLTNAFHEKEENAIVTTIALFPCLSAHASTVVRTTNTGSSV